MFDVALTRPLALSEPAAPELDLGLPERIPQHVPPRRPQSQSQSQQQQQRPTGHLGRVVAHSSDRVAWLRARSRGITATDVAKLSTPRSIQSAAYDKLHGTGFGGNVYTQHGRDREPQIASWVAATHGIHPSDALFHAERDLRHLATPDGLALRSTGTLELAEIKTTNKEFRSIPRNYLRQIWWQQYVLGAERTLFVWEQHVNFIPVHEEPQCQWVDRDDAEIAKLVALAADLIAVLQRSTQRAG